MLYFTFISAAICLGSQADAAPPIPEQYYEIVPLHSRACLDVRNASVAGGTAVLQAPCFGSGNQKWKFRSVGGGYYEIVAQHSRQCLDVPNASTAHGTELVQGPCFGNANQHFRLNEVGSNEGQSYYEIIAQHSQMCIDVKNASHAHGAPLAQAPCFGTANQRFILRSTQP
ncbi:hypothetical protein BE11_42405 [Sorangium cellulosum]|nr:hypothetical protein BE11_42405 [Sorangium cellulosum]